MKTTIIHGQSHEGSTCRLARMLAEKLGGNPADAAYWKEKGWTGKARPW